MDGGKAEGLRRRSCSNFRPNEFGGMLLGADTRPVVTTARVRQRPARTLTTREATDAHLQSILIPGSGPIVIGQAAEFDYSGTQRGAA